MRPVSPKTIVIVELECARGKMRRWSMPAFNQLKIIAAHQSSSGVQSIMAEGTTWSSWMGRWTGIATSRFWGITCYHGRGGYSDGWNFVFVKKKASPHVARNTVAFLDQHDVEVMDCPAMSPDAKLIEHVWDQSGHKSWIVLLPIWPNCVKLSTKRDDQFGGEGW